MKRNKLAVWSFALVLIAYLLIGSNILITNLIEFSLSNTTYILSGLFWLAGLISIITFILGIVALRRIKKKEKGKDLAIATIILSGIIILFYLYLFYALYQLAYAINGF